MVSLQRAKQTALAPASVSLSHTLSVQQRQAASCHLTSHKCVQHPCIGITLCTCCLLAYHTTPTCCTVSVPPQSSHTQHACLEVYGCHAQDVAVSSLQDNRCRAAAYSRHGLPGMTAVCCMTTDVGMSLNSIKAFTHSSVMLGRTASA